MYFSDALSSVRTLVLLLSRSLGLSVSRSFMLLVSCSVALSLGRPVALSLSRSLAMSLSRSLALSLSSSILSRSFSCVHFFLIRTFYSRVAGVVLHNFFLASSLSSVFPSLLSASTCVHTSLFCYCVLFLFDTSFFLVLFRVGHGEISFAGVAHLTCGGRSCSRALYRSPSCTIVGSYRGSIVQTDIRISNCENTKTQPIINTEVTQTYANAAQK